jgi:hypothetical protein
LAIIVNIFVRTASGSIGQPATSFASSGPNAALSAAREAETEDSSGK